MFSFITRKIEEYISSIVQRIIVQYGLDKIDTDLNDINFKLNNLEKNVNKNIDVFKTQDRQFDDTLSNIYIELGNKIDENTVKKILNKELSNISDEILGNLKINKEQVLSNINAEVSRILNEYKQTNQSEIDSLRSSLQNEISKNNRYIQKILDQEKKISELNAVICEMKSDIENLKNIHTTPLMPLKPTLMQTQPDLPVEDTEPPVSTPIFGSDSARNNKKLKNIIDKSKVLRERVEAISDDIENLAIYLKLVDKCIAKLERLLEKSEAEETDADTLANACVKIYRQTILKAMFNKKINIMVDEYMSDCKFRKLKWNVGKKLSDNDFEYLDEPIFWEDVEDKALNYTIRDIKRDTYIIDYIDEGDKYEAVMAGEYCIGKFKE